MPERHRQDTREHASARQDEREPTHHRPSQTQRSCPECEGQLVSDETHAETVCEECGLVIDEAMIDRGPEWRAYSSAETAEKSRVGAPTTSRLHDKGLTTTIGWQNTDAYGRQLTRRQRRRLGRLRVWDERIRTTDTTDRNLQQALGELDRMASALGLPAAVRETASVIYRRALDEDLLRGRSIEGMATAALHAAARRAGLPRSDDEMAAVSRIDKLEFQRAYRYLGRQLDLAIEPSDPASYVARFASELGLSDRAERRARELLTTAKAHGLHSGKSPVGLAAAALYAATLGTDETVTQREVGEVTSISEMTIRNRYQELLDAHGSPEPAG